MSNAVDWSVAPEDAEYFNAYQLNFYKIENGNVMFFDSQAEIWCNSMCFSEDKLKSHKSTTRRPAPQGKPMKYEYGVEYPTNGVKPDLPDDVLVEFKKTDGNWNTLGCDEVRGWCWGGSMAFKIVDQRYKPAAAPVEPTNIYDRTITGKYGTGKCTIDVYRVLAAYDVTDSEVAHAVKKLLAPGQRGVKEERQDIEEAIQSLQAWIDRMDDEGVK